MLDLQTLVPKLAKILPRSSTLIVDNTCMSVQYQPLSDLPFNPFGMRLVVVESLLKYHQFGLDRVSGGVVWAPAGSEEGLFGARMHLGTIIPDISTHSLPVPNRKLLQTRLERIGRNARILAETLDKAVQAKQGKISHVVYPSLPSYPGYAWTRNLPFQGSFLVLTFKPRYQRLFFYDLFVSRVMAVARKRGIDLIAGSSFGFDTSRIYIAARYTNNLGEAFVRISVGTETLSEIQALAEVFAQVISHDAFI